MRLQRVDTRVDGDELTGDVVIEGEKIGTELVGSSLKLADVDARGTNIRLHLLCIRMELVQSLLHSIHIPTQEHRLCTRLADTRLQLKDTTPDLVDICPQGHHVEIDTVGDGVVVGKLATDVVILAVSSFDIAILGQYGRSKFKHTGVELIHAVVELG